MGLRFTGKTVRSGLEREDAELFFVGNVQSNPGTLCKDGTNNASPTSSGCVVISPLNAAYNVKTNIAGENP